MNKLQNIAARQRKSLVRDALFATFVALAAIVSATTVAKTVVASAQFQQFWDDTMKPPGAKYCRISRVAQTVS